MADAAFDAEIERSRRELAALREEVNELKAALARRRLEEAKYSPTQPRVPAGNPRGGQWTDRSGRGAGGAGFDNTNAEGAGDATSGTEDAANSGNSYDATPSTDAATSSASEGDGTRGTDDRLAASDKPSPGRAAMLGIMARAAEKVVQLYRSENLLNDLFGNRTGAVAVTTMDDKDIFGSNSASWTYKDADFKAATDLRDKLVAKYPTVMSVDNVGYTPGNALFHAETNVLLRAAEANGGTLAGRSLDIYVDRKMCRNCETIVPLVGLELGNPTLTYVDPYSIYSDRERHNNFPEQTVRKNCYLHDYHGPFWPRPDQLEKDFLAPRGRLWASPNGNDHWGLGVEGLYGTDALPHSESVNVKLDMIGSPDHGVLLQYDKWDGRIQRRDCYLSRGDLSRLGRFMYNLHVDPYSLALFIPFEAAFKAVKEFIERDGELPTSIEWVAAADLPPETFPVPTWPPQKLPG